MTSKLTANVGLRFDWNGVPVDSKGLWRTLDFPGDGGGVEGRGQGFRNPDGTIIPTVFPGEVNENGAVKLFKQRVRFFMPRVGIAYRPWDKWVLRVGAGWFDNAFNTPYFGDPNGIGFSSQDTIIPDGPRMGEIRSLRTPMRIIQFGLKLHF